MQRNSIVSAAVATVVVGLTTSGAFATVITPTYTADQAAFPGTPWINTTGTSSGAVNTNFTTNVPTANGGLLDQSFVATASGTLGQIAFYAAGTNGTTGSAVSVQLYQLGTAGTRSTGGFQGGGDADQYVFPNASVATGAAGGNPDLLATFAPTFDVSGSGNNRYVTLDLTAAGVALVANTTYVVQLDNTSATEIDARRTGATDFYTSGNIYGGSNTAGDLATGNRGLPNSGGVRDGAFAVYYAAATGVPEPASLGLIGLGGAALIGRRRRPNA